jgi:hypothetical protein
MVLLMVERARWASPRAWAGAETAADAMEAVPVAEVDTEARDATVEVESSRRPGPGAGTGASVWDESVVACKEVASVEDTSEVLASAALEASVPVADAVSACSEENTSGNEEW